MKGHPGRDICTVTGCGKPLHGQGYCGGHRSQFLKYGKIIKEKLGVFEKKVCSVPGCGEPLKARGLCSRHTAQYYAHGKVISAEKMKNKNRGCKVSGCERVHRSDGYCVGHLGQIRKHGRIVSEVLSPRVGIMAYGDYVWIKAPDHPYNKDGYVKRANLVWEEETGQAVIPPAVIHHKNGNKKDDLFRNLEYFSCDGEHQSARHRLAGHFGAVPGGIIYEATA